MGSGINREVSIELLTAPTDEAIAKDVAAATTEPVETEAVPVVIDTDPKRITINNYGTVQNQKFISIEMMNGVIHL